jgi:hypothetical protein
MYSLRNSQKIFSELTSGKVINRTSLANNNSRIDNFLFVEIMTYLDEYRKQYKMCGYDFIETPNYIYIKDKIASQESLKTDLTMKICVLLLILGKHLNNKNYKLSKLTDITGGISKADIEEMEENEETKELLTRANLKKGLFVAIQSNLINKNILLEKPSDGTFILSDIGIEFFEDIFKNYSSE